MFNEEANIEHAIAYAVEALEGITADDPVAEDESGAEAEREHVRRVGESERASGVGGRHAGGKWSKPRR